MYKNKNVIGICTAELDQKFHVKMLQRVTKELTDLGYYVMIFGSDSDMYHLSDSDIADASVFNLMNFERVDVVVLFAETIKQNSILTHIVQNASSAKVPVISVGKEIERCFNVIYDTASAFEKLVRHIVEYHGIREVNFISGNKGNEVAEERLEIYHRVLDENDILFEEERVGYGDFWFLPTRRVMDEFIQPSKVPPEAIICANDSMAVTVCDYLKEHDIKVPEEIIVAGIDGIDEGIKHTPGITTCVRDEVNDAKTIANLAGNLCKGQMVSRHTVLEYHMQLSQSCGCQETHLFDSDALISKINLGLEAYHADVRKYYEMSENFLSCKDDEAFWKTVEKYMPDNSFICINSGLGVAGRQENSDDKMDGFSQNLQTMVKLDGKVEESECFLENVVPEAGKDVPQDKPVLLLPIHFCDKIVGYMGIWDNMGNKVELDRIIHFLLNVNCSAGARLARP